jgi:nucleotide-binding universal stress UspA family protein
MTQSAMIRWSTPETILVATNLLEESSFVNHAIDQARISWSKVLLVHLVPGPGSMTETTFETSVLPPSSVIRSAKAKLDDLARRFLREDIECEPIVITGLPEEEIPQLVKSRSVDRVIVADRNASGVARLVAGSVVEELIAAVEVPVCVVGRRVIPKRACGTPFERILVATSLHQESSLLAKFATTLAGSSHSHLTLLHVLDNADTSSPESKRARDTARERLFALVPNEAMGKHQPFLLIDEGDPATTILREAVSMSEDLVILGCPRPSMVSPLLDESVAHRVIAESQCPVMTVRLHAANAIERMPELTGVQTVPAHS